MTRYLFLFNFIVLLSCNNFDTNREINILIDNRNKKVSELISELSNTEKDYFHQKDYVNNYLLFIAKNIKDIDSLDATLNPNHKFYGQFQTWEDSLKTNNIILRETIFKLIHAYRNNLTSIKGVTLSDSECIEIIYFLFQYHKDIKNIVTPQGNKIIYSFVGNRKYSITIESNENQVDILDTFNLGTGHPVLDMKWESDSIMELNGVCGNPCWFSVIINLKTKDFKTYMYPITYDRENNLIAYCTEDIDSTTMIIVENYISLQSYTFKGGNCNSYWLVNCIDSISIKDKLLYIQWYEGNFIKAKNNYEVRKNGCILNITAKNIIFATWEQYRI